MRLTSRRWRYGALGAVTAAATAVAATAPPATAGTVPPPAAGTKTKAVIVVLRDQIGSAPADAAHVSKRAQVANGAQQAVLARLSGAKATKVKHFVTGNAFAATVTAAQAQQLAADPAVASVVDDTKVPVAPAKLPTTGNAAGAQRSPSVAADPAVPASPAAVDPAACGATPRTAKLEPEALQTLNVRSENKRAKTAAQLGVDGAGVKVAYIADGINPKNKAFLRANGKSAIIDYKDFYGDGPNAITGGAEAFGDAGAVVAQGRVYDVATFANPKVVSYPGGHCYIRILGVAPGASVVALKAGSELLPNSAILQAIDYAVRVQHVDVLNESFGGDIIPDAGARNTIELFNSQAVKAGVTVTVSSGDAGVTSTIGNPASDPAVISVGATTDSRIYEQTGYALATLFGNGHWRNSNISALSSAGVTEFGRTIDVSAPGEADWAPCDSSTRTVGGETVQNFENCTGWGTGPVDIQSFGGTSQSAPLTAGVAALVIQAYRKAHRGSSPTPALVKKFISSTTRDLGFPGDEQGTGLVDARAAVEAALTYKSTAKLPAGVSSNVLLSKDQLNLQGAPGTTATGTVTVTNAGRKAVTIASGTRDYGVVAQDRQDTTIDTTSTEVVPYPVTGAPWVVKKVTFTVPSNADRLVADIIWQAPQPQKAGTTPVVRMSVFSPDGAFQTNTRPQGGPTSANYGSVDIRRPTAGTWTAVLYTPQTTGYTGPVSLRTTSSKALPVGSVSPSATTIRPGRSAAVTVRVPVPAVGGDAVDTLSIGSSGGHQTAVPVIVRAVLKASARHDVPFAGTITGGNARGSFAQKFSYTVDVPKGAKDLDAFLKLGDDPATNLQTILVDPNGEVQSGSSNTVQTAADGTTARGLYAQNVVANPLPGRWSYVVIVLGAVSGKQFQQRFSGQIALDGIAAGVSAPGVPGSAAVKLAAGKPVTLKVSFKNTGVVPLAVQTDGRLKKLTDYQLAPIAGSSRLTLPQSVDDLTQLPVFYVPSGTKRISVTASSTTPAQVELNSQYGGIDVFGDLRAAQGGSTVSTATVAETTGQVGIGPAWSSYVQQIGPFGNDGAPAGESVVTATARTQAFDPAVTSSTGDPYLAALDPRAHTGTPAVVDPGDTGTVTVTVTPTGKAGTVVNGVLNLVQPSYGAGSGYVLGDVLATVPYHYTIG